MKSQFSEILTVERLLLFIFSISIKEELLGTFLEASDMSQRPIFSLREY